MKTITTTLMRKNISDIINQVKYRNLIIGVGRRDETEVIIMKYPENLNKNLNEITNINANSASFGFLKNEPELYSVNDLKKVYV